MDTVRLFLSWPPIFWSELPNLPHLLKASVPPFPCVVTQKIRPMREMWPFCGEFIGDLAV
ncbi:hypothetical protein [Gymnodinialimonas sp. 57CJ19]|uniref:hypothetical protein n=1 Tax=Gymnodinialimonas sp. 57CJ19 TaxID=3138498 RepID=UPI0031346398